MMASPKRKLSPRDAVERWLDSQRVERSDETLSSYWYRLKLFVEWCEKEDIENVSDLDGWLLDEYEAHRRATRPSTQTLKNELTTLKNWLEYCERIEVAEGLSEKIDVPSVPTSEQVSSVRLDAEAAKVLLGYCRDFDSRHGTRDHVMLELAWHTGARAGALIGLDVDDLHERDGQRFVLFQNRPATGTRLKKGDNGERPVALPAASWDALDQYVVRYRQSVTDEHGRKPLLASQTGRPVVGTLRDWCYEATQPCIHSDCPHGYEHSTCEYREHGKASGCPSSRSPHQIRTGAITWMLDRGIPVEVVAKRVNSKPNTIEQHYDVASPVDELVARRAGYVPDVQEDSQQ